MGAKRFAIFGAKPEFDKPLPLGQFYFPSWERYKSSVQGIFERQYYNNNGPLLDELEDKLRQFLGVKHAICVANATLGLMMVADALELSGKVILPAFAFVAPAQSLPWAGLEPVFCDIDVATGQIAIEQIVALLDKDVSAILGVNLWGGACNPKELSDLAAANGVQLYFDSAHAFGCTVDSTPVGNFGHAEVFSFRATEILSGMDGGCICTNDDYLAARLRSIRPSYGPEKPIDIVRVANARMSEVQAAIALMSLEDFPVNRQHNEHLFHCYETQLKTIPGLHLIRPTGVSVSNYQNLICNVDACEFGLSPDLVIDLLNAENVLVQRYCFPGLHRCNLYAQDLPKYLDQLPNTDSLGATSIQFPMGALVSAEYIERICNLLLSAHQAAAVIREKYE